MYFSGEQVLQSSIIALIQLLWIRLATQIAFPKSDVLLVFSIIFSAL